VLAQKNKKYVLQVGRIAGKVPTMFSRIIKAPSGSFFLLGPRGTGKSTWISEHFSGARTYDFGVLPEN
jgi:type II secretory ATPase GspE/PulE/Tfp pilus assembly ATPase PilB-like protein